MTYDNAQIVRGLTVVVEMSGGVLNCVRSSAPVRVIFLDDDTEGGDGNCVREVNGRDVYVSEFCLHAAASQGMDGIDPKFVFDVVDQVEPTLSEEN